MYKLLMLGTIVGIGWGISKFIKKNKKNDSVPQMQN